MAQLSIPAWMLWTPSLTAASRASTGVADAGGRVSNVLTRGPIITNGRINDTTKVATAPRPATPTSTIRATAQPGHGVRTEPAGGGGPAGADIGGCGGAWTAPQLLQ